MTIQRQNNMDFVRLFAATLVILGHAYPINGQPGAPALLGAGIHSYAVKIFFAISGYLVTKSWCDDPHIFRFAARRALRIMPALILVTVFAVFVVGPIFTTRSISDYFADGVTWAHFHNLRLYIHYGLPGVFEGNPLPSAVNGSLWSLPAEVMMYLTLAALGLLSAFGGLRLLLLTPVISTVLLNLWLAGQPDLRPVFYATDMRATASLAPYFLAGATLYAFRDIIRPSMDFAMTAFVMALLLHHFSGPAGEPFFVVATSFSAISFGLASTPGIRSIGRIGDLSYGTYLFAFPVQQSLAQLSQGRLDVLQSVIVATLITYLLAGASWWAVEKPALTLKPKHRRREAMTTAEGMPQTAS